MWRIFLYNEKKEEEERDKIRRKVIPIVERTNKNRKGGNEWTRKDVPSIKETFLDLE